MINSPDECNENMHAPADIVLLGTVLDLRALASAKVWSPQRLADCTRQSLALRFCHFLPV
jgi:hypothetical protein